MNGSLLKPVVIIGGGGHASVLVDILRSQNREILAILSPDKIDKSDIFNGIIHVKDDQEIKRYSPSDILLVNAIGMQPRSKLRYDINQYFLDLGFQFETVISQSSEVSEYAKIDAGVQIFAGSIVQAGAHIKAHSIINSGVIVEHDCDIGCYNHLAPGVILCGQVNTGEHVYIGAGATVIPNINIASQSVIAAGAHISKNVFFQQTVYPACTFIKEGKV